MYLDAHFTSKGWFFRLQHILEDFIERSMAEQLRCTVYSQSPVPLSILIQTINEQIKTGIRRGVGLHKLEYFST